MWRVPHWVCVISTTPCLRDTSFHSWNCPKLHPFRDPSWNAHKTALHLVTSFSGRRLNTRYGCCGRRLPAPGPRRYRPSSPHGLSLPGLVAPPRPRRRTAPRPRTWIGLGLGLGLGLGIGLGLGWLGLGLGLALIPARPRRPRLAYVRQGDLRAARLRLGG